LGAQSTLNPKSCTLIVDTTLGRVDVIATSPTIQDLTLVLLVDATEVFYATPSPARYALTNLILERDRTVTNSKKPREFLRLPWLSLPFQDSTIWTITTVCCYYLCHAYVEHFTTVSIVDGYNLPMMITNNRGCAVPSCPVDLGPSCEL